METNLVVEGLKFMALGMGTVFLFLLIMIGAMILQAKIIHRFFPEPNEGAVPVQSAKKETQESKKNKVAAIVAAIIEDKKIVKD